MSTPFFEEARSGGCQPAFAFRPVLPNHRQRWTEEKQSVNGSSRGRKMCDANRTDVIHLQRCCSTLRSILSRGHNTGCRRAAPLKFSRADQPLPSRQQQSEKLLTLSSEECIFVSVKAFASTCSSRVPQDKTATATDGTQTSRHKKKALSRMSYLRLHRQYMSKVHRALREASTGHHQAAVAARWRSTYRKCTQILLPF